MEHRERNLRLFQTSDFNHSGNPVGGRAFLPAFGKAASKNYHKRRGMVVGWPLEVVEPQCVRMAIPS